MDRNIGEDQQQSVECAQCAKTAPKLKGGEGMEVERLL